MKPIKDLLLKNRKLVLGMESSIAKEIDSDKGRVLLSDKGYRKELDQFLNRIRHIKNGLSEKESLIHQKLDSISLTLNTRKRIIDKFFEGENGDHLNPRVLIGFDKEIEKKWSFLVNSMLEYNRLIEALSGIRRIPDNVSLNRKLPQEKKMAFNFLNRLIYPSQIDTTSYSIDELL